MAAVDVCSFHDDAVLDLCVEDGGAVTLPLGGRTGACKQFHGEVAKDKYAFIQAHSYLDATGR